jgi:colanic acid biosynthesis glycosyl transferase WcaI
MNRVYPPVRGATGRVLRDIARSFAHEGWHVTVVSSGPEPGETREDGIRIIRVKGPEKPSGALIYIWVWLKMLVIALRLKKRHILVTMSDPPMIVYAGMIASKIKGCKHINWCHDLYPEVVPALGMKMSDFWIKFFTKRRRKAMNTCDKVIVSGRCMAQYLTKDGLDARRVAMVPNWPDIELTDPEMLDSEGTPYVKPEVDGLRPFEKQLKSKQRFRVLYSGNIGLVHPIDSIIEAAQKLHDQDSDVEFVFVGDGERFDRIAKERSERGLDNIRLLPYQPISQLREVLESGDVHLVTLKEEAASFVVPSKLYAALAVARPSILIGPTLSETAKVINDFKAGKVVSPDDVDGLVAAIKAYRENGEVWFEAHQGAVNARDVFTPQESIEAWMEKAWELVKDDLVA